MITIEGNEKINFGCFLIFYMEDIRSTEPEVVIVLVNYRNPLDTIECLESILKLSYWNCRTIIVDNSENGDLKSLIELWLADQYRVVTKFPDIIYPPGGKPKSFLFIHEGQEIYDPSEKIVLIHAKKNGGFAYGNNIAIRYALSTMRVEMFWLLNNDTVVEKESLSSLVYCAMVDKKIGIVGSKLLYYNNPHLIQGIGGVYNKWFGKIREVANNKNDITFHQTQKNNFDYVIGASMLIKKDFLLDVGFMDEDLFLYFEELDLALRAKRNGWTLSFSNQSIVYHKLGASINPGERKSTALSDYYAVRNRILISRKYFPYALITLYPSFLIFVINRIRRKEFRRIAMLLRILVNPKKHFFDS